jgi:MFS family permease
MSRVARGRPVDRAWKRDFHKLWAALSVSLVGSEITALALPLMAALTLGASPLEMGVLAAAGQLPFFLCSLPAGVWVDRLPRRPVLIATDVGSALLLLSIPLAVPFGGPEFVQLCVVAFGVGTLTVVSEVAHYAYVPTLVGRRHLTEYNGKLQVSHSASSAAGPGLGGLLVQLVSAPMAVLADAVSFLASAGLLAAIRGPEPAVRREEQPAPLRQSIADGLRMLLGHPLLRPIIVGGSIANLFESGLLAIYVLYATRELGLNPGTIGLIFALGGVAAVPGGLLADRVGKRIGVGRAILGGWALAAVAALVVPLAAGPRWVVVVMLAFANAFGALTYTVANVQQWSLRQTVAPDHLAGRVTAGHRFVVYGAGAIGAMLGGVAGSAMGMRPALFVCASGMLLGPVVALASPLRRLRDQPVDEADPARVDELAAAAP